MSILENQIKEKLGSTTYNLLDEEKLKELFEEKMNEFDEEQKDNEISFEEKLTEIEKYIKKCKSVLKKIKETEETEKIIVINGNDLNSVKPYNRDFFNK